MKSLHNDKARHVRVRTFVAYPAVSVALVVSIALALTPIGPSQVMALDAPAPAVTATTTASPTPTPRATPLATGTTPSPNAIPSPAPFPSPAPPGVDAPGRIVVEHHVLARIEGSELQANYLPVDVPVPDAEQFQAFRVRFQLRNTGTSIITSTPRLEFRASGGTVYAIVPEQSVVGIPMYIAREWVPDLDLDGGTKQGPLREPIPINQFRTGKVAGGFAVNGQHSMGANPDLPVTLPSSSFTEQEFTVQLTMDAKYLTDYEFRITDAGSELASSRVATIRLGAPPAVRLSPGQRQGIDATGPENPDKPLTAAGASYPLLTDRSTSTTSFSAVSAVYRPQAYPLVTNALSAATITNPDTHGPFSMTASQCGVCHRTHVAKAQNLLAKTSQSQTCLTCHDGTGASAKAYSDPATPPNVAANREFYSHDGVATSATSPTSTTHTQSGLDEFSIASTGGVPNRHSECADCHNPHRARATPDSAQTFDPAVPTKSTGWNASGSLAGVSGVSVVNGAAGTAPAYTFLNGISAETSVTREYQICFKCHSGFTKLTSNAELKTALYPLASKFALDKGVEFNPANPSFHPIEAAGTNGTSMMTASLSGTSPYKLWNFSIGSTIRCLNCHASSTTPGPNPPLPTTPAPAAGAALPPHTSSNRGILLRNYKDRILKPRNDILTGAIVTDKAAYSAGDFALCYVCHAESPFVGYTRSDAPTNFREHGRHVSQLGGKGSGGTGIDVPGDGQSNAICAECHFRIHSTKNDVDTQVARSRLVNFAPNVSPSGGTISWTPDGEGRGSCTLTCHGYEHDRRGY